MLVHYDPPPHVRKYQWDRRMPVELVRAADEWASLGDTEYAEALYTEAEGGPDAEHLRPDFARGKR